MADLIERVAVLPILAGLARTQSEYDESYDKLMQITSIEAEPVRHGKLLEGKTFNDQHCSVCGQRFRDDISFILPSDENGFPMPKRCPECGCYWEGGASDAVD
jgi:hypothetical protein